jgi:hypothetical protein
MKFRQFIEQNWVLNRPMATIAEHLHKMFSSVYPTTRNRLTANEMSNNQIVYIDIDGWKYGGIQEFQFAFNGKLYQMILKFNKNYFELQKDTVFEFSLQRLGCIKAGMFLSLNLAWKQFGTKVSDPHMFSFIGFQVSSPHQALGIVEEVIKSDNFSCGGFDTDDDSPSETPFPLIPSMATH